MTTKVRIVSDAFIKLGRNPINDLESGGLPVSTAAARYNPAVDFCLARFTWSFAKAFLQLTRLTASPPAVMGWRYAFELPANVIQIYRTYETHDYELRENLLYCNAEKLSMDYIFKPDESRFPSYFAELVTAYLAADICMYITGDKALKTSLTEEASMQYRIATYIDSRARPQRQIRSNPLFASRF